MLRIVLLSTFVIALSPLFSKTTEQSDTLLIGFDGIGYSTVMEMYNGGYFRDFQRPIPMVATFPSISDPNWAHIMNAPVEEGYTKAHFFMKHKDNNGQGKEVGSVLKHITYSPEYEKKFSFKSNTPLEHIMNVTWMKTSAKYWIDDLQKRLLEQTKPAPFSSAFIINTDFISHTAGKKDTLNFLKFVHLDLVKLRKQYKDKFNRNLDIFIVSDHGNHWVKPTSIDFKSDLNTKGWRWHSTLQNKNDFAFVAPEIISFGAFYTLKGEENRLAKDLSLVKGVHVALAIEKENVINVYSKKGTSQITVDPKKKRVSYNILNGEDPLEQMVLFKEKKEMSWEDYFIKSQDTNYPNSLVNAWEGFYINSKTPGSVLAASDLNYVFTNLTLEILTSITGLYSTHGSFHKFENYGVFMSTKPLKEDFVRPQDILKIINN